MIQKNPESAMPVSEYLFIHPWFHPDETWAGFHVEFSGPDGDFPGALSRMAQHPALRALDPRLLWFIPVTGPESIAGARALAGKDMVFLLRASAPDRETLETALRRGGARLGLMLTPNDPLTIDGTWSHIVLTAGHARTLPSYSLRDLSAKAPIAVTGLRSRNDLAWAAANYCSLVTNEYLLGRSAPCGKPDMLRVRLLKLLSLIAEDADTCEIEEIFRQEPKLAYGLLRLVNLGTLAPRTPITSFGQAITLLGRRQLQRWLQLLVYADPNDGQHPNPLLLQAAIRGRLMEALAHHIAPQPEVEEPLDAAFMVGTFSLLDVLLNLSMSEILQQLPLPKAVRAALEEGEGPLGNLLMAITAGDNRELESAGKLLRSLGIDGDAFASAQLSTLQWAGHIRVPIPAAA